MGTILNASVMSALESKEEYILHFKNVNITGTSIDV